MAQFANFANHHSTGATSQSFALTLGAGTKRKVVVAFCHDETSATVSNVRYNGQVATLGPERQHDGGYTSGGVHFYWYDVPDALAAGSYNVTFDMSAGASGLDAKAWQTVGSTTGAPEASGTASINDGTAAISCNLTVTAGAIILSAMNNSAASPTHTWSGGAVTERQESDESNFTSTAADGEQASSGSKTVTCTASSGSANKVLVAISIASAPTSSAAVTGTGGSGMTGSEVRAGGKTLILTLTGDTFNTFDNTIRQAIIDGVVAASSPTWGWNNTKASITASTAVVRTSATVCTITLPALAGYQSDSDETLTITIPAAAVTLAAAIVATETVTIGDTDTDLTPVDDYTMTGTATRTRP